MVSNERLSQHSDPQMGILLQGNNKPITLGAVSLPACTRAKVKGFLFIKDCSGLNHVYIGFPDYIVIVLKGFSIRGKRLVCCFLW